MDIRSMAVSRPLLTYSTLSSIFAFFALSPSPSLIATIGLISIIRVSAWVFAHRRGGAASAFTQIVAISIFAGLAQLSPSLQALSNPTTSLVVLGGISVLTTSLATFVAFCASYIERQISSPWVKLTLFPALWATAWGFISYVSPVGQLATWSPVVGLGPYLWLRQYLGQWGINWVAGAWASICAVMIGNWIVGTPDDEEKVAPLVEVPQDNERLAEEQPGASRGVNIVNSHSKETLVSLLIVLMIPSWLSTNTPLPSFSDETTPFGIGCALPIPRHSGQRSGLPTLDDYIYDSRTLQMHADVVVWPESAVRFTSPTAKADAFREMQLPKNINRGKYWGVSFEEYIPADLGDGVFKKGSTRNGFALLGSSGPPVLEYYKRNLVPVAESFPLVPGTEDPGAFTIQLKAPKNYNKSDWAPAPNYTRPIPVTTSICLDLATSQSFSHLESRPSLILAPAKTWHIGIGLAMWEQAKARAHETGSTVIWCDGGEGGVSGVAGGGYEQYTQVGQGSFYKTIGISYPFNEKRTVYARGGQSAAFWTAWAIVGLGYAIEGLSKHDRPQAGNSLEGRSILRLGHLVTSLRSIFRGNEVQAGESRPLLE
ncbi:hypothetical protein QCA50_002171 [Cerrena zonata]|uniref:CN hydrolase domain-containing protein n=1 Tax=Cerrena zonata TaxID=2478898 RepID=A0AAW0GWG4_9APHY